MESLHETLHNCRAHAQRHGGRRRRCVVCGRTWTVHQRKQGRKKLRVERDLPRRLLLEKQPARGLMRRRRSSSAAFYRRARAAFEYLAAKPYWPQLPQKGELILLVDGLWFRFRGTDFVLYTLALKALQSNVVHLLDPMLLEGHESGERWQQVIAEAIGSDVSWRIRALVADGFRGAHRIVAEHGWVYQRCHWHLLSVLQGLRGAKRSRVHGCVMREAIYQLVCEILVTTDEQRVLELSGQLRLLAQDQYLRNRRIRYLVGGLLRDLDHFRAYLRHPELRLPNTGDVLKSQHALIRQAVNCVNSPSTALTRAKALIRLHPTLTCNTPENPQN